MKGQFVDKRSDSSHDFMGIKLAQERVRARKLLRERYPPDMRQLPRLQVQHGALNKRGAKIYAYERHVGSRISLFSSVE
jgi:hypothetical protein